MSVEFVDTDIVLYSLSNDVAKRRQALTERAIINAHQNNFLFDKNSIIVCALKTTFGSP